MTERDNHIEMAQRLGLVGMRPHLDGIYIEVLAAFAKNVADEARATPALPQHDWKQRDETDHSCTICGADSDGLPGSCVPALPQGVEDWLKKHAFFASGADYSDPNNPDSFDADVVRKSDIEQLFKGMAIVPVELVEAVANIGNDFGYGRYEVEERFVKMAQSMLPAAKEKGE